MSLDPKMEAEARKWIEAVLERPVFDSFDGPDGLHNALKDGVVSLHSLIEAAHYLPLA